MDMLSNRSRGAFKFQTAYALNQAHRYEKPLVCSIHWNVDPNGKGFPCWVKTVSVSHLTFFTHKFSSN